MNELRSLFEYDNYRAFLKDYYEWSKTRNPKFSFRFFSRLAGFQSPSFLKHVMEGERNLSLESIEKFARAMKLNQEESLFFKNLVLLNQAKTVAEKQNYSKEILRSKSYRKIHPLKEAQVRCFSEWYYLPIREMVGVSGFKENPEWIAKHLMPHISADEAQRAIGELLVSGLLERDSKGKLVQANRFVGVPDSVILSSQAHSHKELIRMAAESIDTVPRESREIGAVTLRLSSQSVGRIKEMIQNIRNVIVEEASREPNPDMIYQWNFQLFPMADMKKAGDS